jgi:asparagine synthase (glutamine-hydrolysing)
MDLRFLILATLDGSALPAACAKIGETVALAPVWEASDHRGILFSNHMALALPDDAGAIVGPIFRKHGWPAPITQIDAAVREAIVETGGLELIERYWGNYVALFGGSTRLCILRAPMGQLPCYRLRIGQLIALASDPALLCEAGLYHPQIDWGGVRRHLVGQDLPGERTALLGVAELLPGDLLEIGDMALETRTLWTPWDYVSARARPSRDPLDEQVRRAIMTVCTATASPYGRLLVGVSGGLDSSVVAASLQRAKVQTEALTLASDDAHGDEREYARILCHHLDIPLHESGYAMSDVALDRSLVAHRPRPCGRSHEQAYHAKIFRFARQLDCHAFLTGNGGDNVFYNSQSARAVADRFLSEGIGLGLVETIRNVCLLTQASAIQVIWAAAKSIVRFQRRYVWKADTRLLDRSFVAEEMATTLTHDWLDPPFNPLPGKAAHVAMLLRMQHHLEGYDRRLGLPVLNPLAAQPLVELCLSIPTWEMCQGGRNRSIVRSAFKALLPTSILGRTGKGGPDSFAIAVIEQNLDLVRERLLAGALASKGYLDRTAIEASLRPGRAQRDGLYMRLLFLLDSEAWIDHWSRQTDAS